MVFPALFAEIVDVLPSKHRLSVDQGSVLLFILSHKGMVVILPRPIGRRSTLAQCREEWEIPRKAPDCIEAIPLHDR